MYNSDLNLIVAIIVAFFSATATACAVNRKGRSKLWVFFTILFSPLFLIVELLPNRNKQKAPVLISCPLCHKEISSEVKKCPYCGHNMPRQHSLFAVIYERIICVVWVTVIILGAIGILIDNNNTSFQTNSKINSEEDLQLGLSYYYGNNGKIIDYKKAHDLFLRAANQGNPKAQYSLATSFFTGKGVEEDDNKALFYFKESCNNGLSKGCEARDKLINFKKQYSNTNP